MSISISSALSTGVQGVQAGLSRVNKAGEQIAQLGNPKENGDLTSSIVDLKSGEQQVKASAKVIKSADDLLGTLIDTKA